MIDEKALILIAHTDGHTLLALYALLDAEGYFVAPCFSDAELLRSCAKYQPDLVMTSDPSSEGDGEGLLETIRARSPKTRILILPELLIQHPEDNLLKPDRSEEILRFVESLSVPKPSLHRNGA